MGKLQLFFRTECCKLQSVTSVFTTTESVKNGEYTGKTTFKKTKMLT